MALSTRTQSHAPVSGVGPQYCASSPEELGIGPEVHGTSNFVVTDVHGSVIFRVQEKAHSMHGCRVLVDGAGKPIVTIRKKTISAHEKWKVFKGESDDKSDLIFTVRRSATSAEKTKLDVFLVKNIKESVCDFKVEKSQSENLPVVFSGESSIILAEMHKKATRGATIPEDNSMVKIYPNVDYAFIVILIVIHNECNKEEGKNRGHNNLLHRLPKLFLDPLAELAAPLAVGVAAMAVRGVAEIIIGGDMNECEDENEGEDEKEGEDENEVEEENEGEDENEVEEENKGEEENEVEEENKGEEENEVEEEQEGEDENEVEDKKEGEDEMEGEDENEGKDENEVEEEKEGEDENEGEDVNEGEDYN